MKSSFMAKTIRLALIGGAATTAYTAPALAVEEAAEEVERVEVTGSRIKRADLEGVSPVTILTAENMKLEGNFTVADALRNSNLNSFGSFSETSGSSAQSQATINLRGAGSSRTLVLIDGRRMVGSPTLGGASANLNAIPMAAVQRIEILTDGASSIYGSDAIAGVVNIIMKKEVEGVTINAGIGSRTRDEGINSREFSVVAGTTNDKGSITFAFDMQKRDGIADKDRDFTKASTIGPDSSLYFNTDGWSYYGANLNAPDGSHIKPATNCDSLIEQYGNDTFALVDASIFGPGSEACAFAYANVSYNKASIDRNTVFVDADYQITDNVEWFGRAMVVKNSSFGRYAPPAAPWSNMQATNSLNPWGVADDNPEAFADPNNPGQSWVPRNTDGNPVDKDGNVIAYDPANGYTSTTGYWRWVDVGNRDGNSDDYTQDYVMGFRGELDILEDANWEVYYHHNTQDNKNVGEYYLSYGGQAYIDQNHESDYASYADMLKQTTLTNDKGVMDQLYAGFGFSALELPGGTAGHYFGFETYKQSYASIYDAQSEVGLVGGSAGNSAAGERTVDAAFFETNLPVFDGVEVILAARYDNYSDFGGQTSPKAGITYRPSFVDGLIIRSSYAEAFRAPALDQLYAATSFSAESAIDFVNGGTQPQQFDTWYKSNPNLGPETSDYFNFGFAWDFIEDNMIKVDYFDLKIDNVINTRTVQSLINGEKNGTFQSTTSEAVADASTFYLLRSTSGRLVEAGTGYDNASKLQIKGVDVAYQASFEVGPGDLSFNWVNSFTLDYSYEAEAGTAARNTAGWAGQPKLKSVFTSGYAWSDFGVTYNANYTHSTYEDKFDDNNNPTGKLDSWLIHNVSAYYASPFGKVTASVANLTDEDPVLSANGTWDYPELYNNLGRQVRVNYSISF
ncbi:TonB-dependent receptor [Paraferrimonas sp. SM1919]|uniref:TonB-dependent receptor domain-containing protein n=1 Tax=Paraferrimonas sp. SM1919 TaxID=2662263 RepID=UPI0013CF83D5|nr:TonB-dependent receptor [Paraferrimonas sp. SM1919]